VQNNTQQCAVYLKFAIVFDESNLPEAIHEKVHSGARSANHFRQSLLRYLGNDPMGIILLTVTGEQEQGAGQAFFAGVEELVDQIRFSPDVALQDISDKPV
jgi:hypothetical protein